MPDDGRTRFYPPRAKLLLMAAAAGLVGALFLVPAGSHNTFLTWLGWVGVIGLGLAALVLVARAARPGPTLVLDAEGITDRTTLAPTGLIRWDEITVIRKREIGRGRGAERVLEIMLTDPEAFQARPRSLVRRVADRYRAVVKQPPVGIPGSMVSAPMEQVVAAIRQRRPGLEVLDGRPPARRRPRLISRRVPDPREHPRPPRW